MPPPIPKMLKGFESICYKNIVLPLQDFILSPRRKFIFWSHVVAGDSRTSIQKNGSMMLGHS